MSVPLPDKSDWVVVGQIGAPFGIKGWNHLRSFTRPIEQLFEYHPWYIKEKEGWVAFECEEWRRQGEGCVAKLEGIEDRDRAAMFSQKMIAIQASQRMVLGKNEFYWSDLEGLAVQLATGKNWGHVRYLYENAGVDTMVIEHAGKEYHVPFIFQDTVLAVDFEAGRLILNWLFDYPEG